MSCIAEIHRRVVGHFPASVVVGVERRHGANAELSGGAYLHVKSEASLACVGRATKHVSSAMKRQRLGVEVRQIPRQVQQVL